MSAAPLGADAGAARPTGWLGVGTRSGEDRRKGLGFTANIPSYGGQTVGSVTYYFNGVSQRWQKERRCGKERRVALTAPDDHCPHCGAVGKLESVGSDDQSSWHFTHACDPYKAAEQYRREHPTPDTIQITDEQQDAEAERWHERHYPSGVSDPTVPHVHYDDFYDPAGELDDDFDYATRNDVASILQAEIDRVLLARAQHPSYRCKLHWYERLGLHRFPRVWGEL